MDGLAQQWMGRKHGVRSDMISAVWVKEAK